MLSRLQPLLSLLRRHLRLVIVVVMAMTLALGLALTWRSSQHSLPVNQDHPQFRQYQLNPGRSTHQDVVEVLGPPNRLSGQGEFTVYSYPSPTSYYNPDLLYLKDDVLELQELHYAADQQPYPLEQWMTEHGSPQTTLYLPQGFAGTRLVAVYPSSGLAVFYFLSNQLIYQVHRFRPTSLADYRQQWLPDALDSAPTPLADNQPGQLY